MDKVLNLDYTPLIQEHMNLLNEKGKFMYSMLSTTLQTDRGKKFFREHENDFDVQMVHKKHMHFAPLL